MWRGMVALAVAAALFAGCGGGEGGGKTAKPGGTPGFKTSTANKLPADWPADIPLPEGYKVVYSQSSEQGQKFSAVYFQAKQPAKELSDFFMTKLKEKGWELLLCQTTPSTPQPVTVLSATKDKLSGQFVIGRYAQQPKEVKEPFDFVIVATTLPNPISRQPQQTPVTCIGGGQ